MRPRGRFTRLRGRFFVPPRDRRSLTATEPRGGAIRCARRVGRGLDRAFSTRAVAGPGACGNCRHTTRRAREESVASRRDPGVGETPLGPGWALGSFPDRRSRGPDGVVEAVTAVVGANAAADLPARPAPAGCPNLPQRPRPSRSAREETLIFRASAHNRPHTGSPQEPHPPHTDTPRITFPLDDVYYCPRVRGKEVTMGVPVQVVLDVPPDIAAGLASGALVRVGGVVRDANTGQIVKHLGEVRLPDKEAAKAARAIAQRALNATRGKVGAGIVVVGAVAVAVGGKVAFDWWNSHCRAKDLNMALNAYLDAAKAGQMTVGRIDSLSAAIEAARGGGLTDPVSIAEKVVNLVEGYTTALAEANGAVWQAEQSTDVEPLVRLEHSLIEQRRILGEAA